MPTLDEARQTLRTVFGFEDFRQGQEAVITTLLEGRSSLAIFPTASGKSLCYQLPALMLDGLTLVISPLIALMKDQLDFLNEHHVPAARLDSTLDLAESRQVWSGLRGGRLKMLYVAPERFASERFLQLLRRLPIAMMAVDEAHCISEWGHNFRPDYLKLARIAQDLGAGRVLALTATATPSVARDIAKAFSIAESDIVHTGFYRPNLNIATTPAQARTRGELLLERIQSRPRGPTIVYVTLQRTAEEIAAFLEHNGLPAKCYHAGLDADVRHAVQDWFMASPESIVVATIAFGMGIDKADIRYVYHYNLPKTLENYAQEIGRAGRDGNTSICEMLACADDAITLENFTYGDTPTPEAIQSLLAEVLSAGETFDVSVYELSFTHDIRPLVVETALTYLELLGIIESTGPFYNEYKFQPNRASREILAKFDPERRAFVAGILSCATKAKTWFTLRLDQAMRVTGQTRARVVAAINYLEEQGDLFLQVGGARQGYRMKTANPDRPSLTKRIADRFAQREERDIERMREVLAFVAHPGCHTQRLLAYFGEERGDCGHCAWCKGHRPAPPPPRQTTIGADELRLIDQARAIRHDALASPRQIARFLCGLGSPVASRAKLTKHELFGALAHIPFATVLASAQPRA